MREFSSPTTVAPPRSGSLTDDLLINAAEQPDGVAFSRRRGREWSDVTAAEFLAQVRATAKGLLAAGIGHGDRVVLMSRTRYEWTLLDYALWYVGAVTVPVYETSPAEALHTILRDSGARAALVETVEHRRRLRERADGTVYEGPALGHVWTIDEDALGELALAGHRVSDERLEARRSEVGPGSLATLVYTSGTTGPPRGCMLTHGNFMVELAVAVEELDELFRAPGASTLLFLPMPHILARIVSVGAVRARVRLGHVVGSRTVSADLAAFDPTFVLAVPRVFERIFTTASLQAAADGRSRLFDRAVSTAIAVGRASETGRPGPTLRLRHRLFDRLVYRRLRSSLGERCVHAISGGAPLGERLDHFYRGIGVTVLEGWGLTETTGAVTVNRPDAVKVGTVGRPLGGTSVRVAEDGELHVRGAQVFPGYWNDAEATAEALTRDGWLRTGDVGEIDDEGFVRVTGRKQELMVTAGGKHVSPTALEDVVRAHPLVAQCLVVGDGRPFVAALVTLDWESVELWSRTRGGPRTGADRTDLVDDPALRAEVQRAVDQANAAVSRAESIRRFVLLAEDWTEEGGQLTPSLKLRRTVMRQQLNEEIESLYAR